jgi:uncharacterized repeat protein (TIGR03803 family)
MGTTDGSHPRQLFLGPDALYGTTDGYGSDPAGNGTVFSLTPPRKPGGTWSEATLYTFMNGSDGNIPYGGVVMDGDGVLYATAFYGGAFGGGTVISLTPPKTREGAWTETTIYAFSGPDGYFPYVGLTIGSGGALYGTTQYGGSSFNGTVFSLTPPKWHGGAWTEAVLHSFTGTDGDGYNPSGVLLVGPNGVLYGTTAGGGDYYSGTVFSLAPPTSKGGLWTETVLHSFDGTDGDNAVGGLAIGQGLGEGLVLYGTTGGGGASNQGTVFDLRCGR